MEAIMATDRYDASWWTEDHDSSWGRTKTALRRDWEQTKHDFGGKSPDLGQDVPDTIKQAAGKERIPGAAQPAYEECEPALRFGHGACEHYGRQYPEWNDSLETQLRKDWSASGDLSDWNRNRHSVRWAYEYALKEFQL